MQGGKKEIRKNSNLWTANADELILANCIFQKKYTVRVVVYNRV